MVLFKKLKNNVVLELIYAESIHHLLIQNRDISISRLMIPALSLTEER